MRDLIQVDLFSDKIWLLLTLILFLQDILKYDRMQFIGSLK